MVLLDHRVIAEATFSGTNMIDQQQRQQVTYFIGTEVEHTMFYNMQTMFIVGMPSLEDITQRADLHKCRHLYFGTSQSYHGQVEWRTTILDLLKQDYLVTLDFNIQDCIEVEQAGYLDFDNFAPMISAKIPNILKFKNATIKLDDTTWGDTNPGVWCHQLTDLLVDSKFTAWDQYGDDTIIG